MTRNTLVLFVAVSTFLSPRLHAQTYPGGISNNLSLWMIADSATTVSSTNATIKTWKDQTQTNTFSISGTASAITVVRNAVNFHSAVRFTGSGATLQGNTSIQWSECSAVASFTGGIASERGTVISPATSGTAANDASRYYFRSGREGSNSYLYAGMGVDSIGFEYITAPPDSQYNLLTASGVNNVFTRNGWDARVGSLYGGFTARATVMNSKPQIGDRSTDDSPLSGYIGEIVLYSQNNATSRNKVESYLALKYGISLGTAASLVNYVSSSGTTYWTGRSGYQHNIFGIGNDAGSGLLQSQSVSMNSGYGNGSGRSGMGNLLIAARTTLGNQQFLMIGTDSATLSEEQITSGMGPSNAVSSWRTKRTWKVQNTGAIPTVLLSFDLAGLSLKGGTTASNYWLLVDPDGDGNFLTGATQFFHATSITSGRVTFASVSLPDNAVFTLLTKPSSTAVLATVWQDFTARAQQNAVSLDWTMPQEENMLHYDIERSANANDYMRIGSQAARQSATGGEYTYIDQPGAGTWYYRIKAVDMDGQESYSPVRTVLLNTTAREFLHLRSNPIIGGRLQLNIDLQENNTVLVRITDRQGKGLLQRQYALPQGGSTVTVDMSGYPAGLYFIQARTRKDAKTLSFVK
ncbi:MAG TPA: T9SS type A sorting domain-containing protein [Puia sp.]|nr:T9SS type A sorting domain-containing protein [Puia sp.]